ncbi:MAG: TonB-dependent receptor, partial [Bryobacteraceae bacterium]
MNPKSIPSTASRHLSVALFFLSPLLAQAPFQGRVLDRSESPIAAAKVHVVQAGKATGFSATSDPNGEFSIPLEPGVYTVQVSKEGFLEDSRSVTLPKDGITDITLQVAPVSGSVTITESPSYVTEATSSATKTLMPLRDVPQSVTIVSQQQIKDQMMMSIGDVVRYIPGITAHQGENNRDQLVIRGNSTSADFFVNGVRDDVQYYRDLYNLERVEALKGPNAMIFGRGGAGGVINRVTKAAEFTPIHEVSLQGGSFGNKRFAADLDQPFHEKAAFRMNGMYENSDSFRKYVNLQRYGISPTLTLKTGEETKITLNYEHFRDYRTADRGISSFQGRPLDIDPSTFFGNPNDSQVKARVNLGGATIEHQAGGLNIRNRTQFGEYDRYYRNYVPGVVTADQSQVNISSYSNDTRRLNMFNQTDLTYTVFTGPIRHTLLGGAEAGRQLTDNFRNTGYFANNATTVLVPLSSPDGVPAAVFRQSATDADNHLRTNLGATYVQDQVQLSRYVQLVAGIRFDHFDLQYLNNRTSDRLRRIDNLLSPRAGIVFKP